jgi:hypothetical protein
VVAQTLAALPAADVSQAVSMVPMPMKRRFQALDSTTVYVLGSDGKLWREIGNYTNRTLVDANV